MPRSWATSKGGGGSSLELETNGTTNGSQSLLNLVAGTNINITDDSSGNITFHITGGGIPAGSPTEIQFNADGTNFGGLVNSAVDSINGFLGINKATPNASGHFGIKTVTVGDPSSLIVAFGTAGVTGGYTFTGGGKSYTINSIENTPGADIFSSGQASGFYSEGVSGFPVLTDFDPQNPSTIFINPAESGYIASGYSFEYSVWALYPNGQISNGSIATSSVSDLNDGSPYAVDVSWTAPINPQSPIGYLVYSNNSSSNPNTGLYQVITGTSFTDNSSGWATSASYSTLLYSVSLSWTGVVAATDYAVQNSTPAYQTPGGNITTFVDANSNMINGTLMLTPTSFAYDSLVTEGTTELVKVAGMLGAFGATPVIQQTGDPIAALVAYGLLNAASPVYNTQYIYYNGTGAPLFSGSTILYLDGSTFADMNAHAFTFAAGASITNAGKGLFNIVNIGSPVSPTSAVAGDIYRNSSSGTLSFSDGSNHSILLDSVALSGAGEVTGILQTNQGGTGSDTAVTTVSGSTSGTAKFAEPFKAAGYKKVTIQLAALVGTASYTFPLAFANTPVILVTTGLASTIITSLSTTAVTVTGATTTGYLTIEGE